MLAYKGVAPGTHYASNDPKLGGFHGDNSQPRQIDDVIRHITAHSWPSAWVSVSMSFAIAADFATSGGMVYEVRLDKIGSADKTDPLANLASYSNLHTHQFLHDHDGHQDLTAGVRSGTWRHHPRGEPASAWYPAESKVAPAERVRPATGFGFRYPRR